MLACQLCHMQLSGKEVTLCYNDKFLISCNLDEAGVSSRSTSNVFCLSKVMYSTYGKPRIITPTYRPATTLPPRKHA